MEYISYEEYEQKKIQEASEIAKKILDGEEKTIPFKTVMKRLHTQIKNVEKSQKKAKNQTEKDFKGGLRYTL